ncbi:MAG: CRISPR-associated endonuclease Cas3'', partial [Synergistaceae bacterium]|nr:CRISPR-associated endonuclease Cas3'' [Synergistaceae bacterium]
MRISDALWAKKPKVPVIGRDIWLPLRSHMSDSAGIARKIWKEWLPPGTKETIASGVLPAEGGGDDLAGQIFVLLAAAHDLGKASPVFQSKGSPITAQLDELIVQNIRDVGLTLKRNQEYNERSASHHSLVSHLILERHGFDESVSVVLGAHHGKPPGSGQLNNISAYSVNCGFDDEQWMRAQDELLNYALELAGLSKADAVGIELRKTAQ